jgi:RimJ/RimL family protein N-acetyltransferase
MEESRIVFKGKTKTGRNLIIRYLQSDDVSILAEFINKLSLEKTFIIFQGEQTSFDDEKEYVDYRIRNINQNKAVHLLAFINNELVGSSDIELKNYVFKHTASFGIVISQKYRGEGIGKILIKSVIREAKKHIKGLKIIKMEVFSNNQVALKLYKSVGFMEYGRLTRGIKYKNKFIDEVLMYRLAK